MYGAYSLVVKLSYSIHIPVNKLTTVPTPNHKFRIHDSITVWSGPCWSQTAMLLRGIDYTLVHFHQCI